jgi:glycine cleavage system aminomethyltransferase T/glycine/D-amino acid oxidase-like deaminating enzyme
VEKRASVVIVGAGIVGTSAAYFLAKKGVRDVVVLDQGPLFETGGSTSHAPGLVFQTNASKTMTTFARRTVELYSSLELDGQPCWYPVGSLEVARTPERWVDLRRKLGWARSWGLDARLVEPDEVQRLVPILDPSVIHGAYHVPSDGLAKAVRACEAMAREARQAGVTFHGHTPVVRFEHVNGRVGAVVTAAGRIAAERVLICAGIWGPKVGRMAGVSIPLTPCQHLYTRTTPVAELAGETREIVHPILRDQDVSMYYRQHADGYGVGSYQHIPLLVDAEDILPHDKAPIQPAMMDFTPEHFAKSWDDAVTLLPPLGRTGIATAFNGMFSFTPDGFPLIGESPDIRGLWVAEAVWVTHGGGVGRTIADLIADGRSDLDLHECDLNRFEPHAHTRSYIRARGAQQYDEVYDIIHPLQQMEHPRPLRTSPFYARQKELGAVFFEARGWERPQWYESNAGLLADYEIPARSGWSAQHWSPIAAAEHLATRARAALFDMTSLQKLEVTGPRAPAFLQSLTTNQIDRPVGSVVYGLLLDESGGIRSDITVTRLGPERFQIGCNGQLDFDWIRRHLPADGSAQVRDITGAVCCLGLWGPRARDVARAVCEDDLSSEAFPYFSARRIAIGEVPVDALRVSYVGELGWELYTPVEYGQRLWDLLWAAGEAFGLVAAGRAAFETLRLEKGYRLWGVDMTTEQTPYEAGVAFAVKLRNGDFIGRAALRERKEKVCQRLACLTFDDPSVVVMGKEPILSDGRVVGYVTSAGFGYSVGKSLAYGYIPAALAEPGTELAIEYFGAAYPAHVVAEPRFDPRRERLTV